MGMSTNPSRLLPHPEGEQPFGRGVFRDGGDICRSCACRVGQRRAGDAAGPVALLRRVSEAGRTVRRLGGGLPAVVQQPERPSKHDLLGTVLLSILSGHYRYAHITALRCDAVNPRLLGMKKVVSEDGVRRGLAKIDEAAGLAWLQRHVDSCASPRLSEPW